MKDENLNQKSRYRVFTVPQGSATSGRLVFTTSALGVDILTDPALEALVLAHFLHQISWVGFEAGIVMVGYYPDSHHRLNIHCPLYPPFHRRGLLDKSRDEITLNTSVPWEIEFRNRISELYADLGEINIESMDVLGGADRIRLLLSRQAKTTYIYITGGIRNSEIRVPPGVGVRVQVNGGVSNLVFGIQRFAAFDRDIQLENSAFKSATSRCEICIAGGANNLTIVEQDLQS